MISAGRDFVLAAKITEGILSTLSKRVGGIISMLQKKKKKNMEGIMTTYTKMSRRDLSGRDLVRFPLLMHTSILMLR